MCCSRTTCAEDDAESVRQAAVQTAVAIAKTHPAVAVNQIVASLVAGSSPLPSAVVMQSVEAVASASRAVLVAVAPSLLARVGEAS